MSISETESKIYRPTKRRRVSDNSLAGFLMENNHGVVIAERALLHRASEQRRRKKVNENLKLLRSVIPECQKGKVDKASMLGFAVDYINELKEENESMRQELHILTGKEHKQKEKNRGTGGNKRPNKKTATTSSISKNSRAVSNPSGAPAVTGPTLTKNGKRRGRRPGSKNKKTILRERAAAQEKAAAELAATAALALSMLPQLDQDDADPPPAVDSNTIPPDSLRPMMIMGEMERQRMPSMVSETTTITDASDDSTHQYVDTLEALDADTHMLLEDVDFSKYINDDDFVLHDVGGYNKSIIHDFSKFSNFS